VAFIEYNHDQILTKYDFNSKLASDNLNYWQKIQKQYSKISGEIKLGGGLSNIEKQHQKGRLTARERLQLVLDDPSDFFELGTFVAYEMYEEWGGCPCGGVIAGLGIVSGKKCMVIANDATVKA